MSLTEKLDLSFPYDWSNPNISEDKLILIVLTYAVYLDIVKVIHFYGLNRITHVFDSNLWEQLPYKIISRMINNASSGLLGKECFSNAPRENIGATFSLFAVKELFETKAVVLKDRVKSRDLYDLMILMKEHGFSLERLFSAIKRIDAPLEGTEPIKEVLVGNIPLDADDPGLNLINAEFSIDDIYSYFQNKINLYEKNQASAYLSMKP